ncbi:MAG: DEAD/DEAH box helicase [Pseudohongiella sp.]|nr:DEAD/DEAH box helicase [Pseudohongiella sp.]
MIKFSIKDIIYMAGTASFKRGEAYYQQNRVKLLNPDPDSDRIVAEVQGKEPKPYQVVLSGAHNLLSADCSCPVGFDCKHGVAAALKWLWFLSSDRRLAPSPHRQEDGSAQLRQWLSDMPTAKKQPHSELSPGSHYLLYNLDTEGAGINCEQIRVTLQKAYLKLNGEWSQLHQYRPDYANLESNAPDFFKAEDVSILNLLRGWHTQWGFQLSAESGALALQNMLASKRLRRAGSGQFILPAEPRPMTWTWQEADDTFKLKATLKGLEQWQLLPLEPPSYLDLATNCIGEIVSTIDGGRLEHLMNMPAVPRADMKDVAKTLRHTLRRDQLPLPDENELIECDTPAAHLIMLSVTDNKGVRLPGLQLVFDYQGLPVHVHHLDDADPVFLAEHQGRQYRVQRNIELEREFFETLLGTGLVLREQLGKWQHVWTPPFVDGGQLLQLWQTVLDTHLPALQKEGWVLSVHADYDMPVSSAAFDISLNDSENPESRHWFDFELSLQNGGKKLSTLDAVEAWLEADTPDELVLPFDGEWVRVDTRPLQTLRSLIEELYQRGQLDKPAQLPAFQAMQFSDALSQDNPDLNTRKAPLTRSLITQLQDFKGLTVVEPPVQLNAELRPYQQQGLNWLMFLQRFGFGGILADDMGLGKTLQTLALLLHLKNSGQLNKPALLVCPTSLTSNWLHEATRFTPDLRVCLIHGSKRKATFEQIADNDLVITTYPLLPRDIKLYSDFSFSLLILDEAQLIKNPGTRISADVRVIKCDTRLCLSGTPLENHLGELWALMDFALPGLLGGRKSFNKQYRFPIEEQGDRDRQTELARRIAPFMLRRSKSDVAQDLPPKTEILQYVELEGKQRTLYEGIRISMEKRIRDLIAQKGMARSHIEFLDALLKLRQACIDPRLVKLEKAADINESAKLNWLSENIPLLLEEGRNILLFSQFTEVLALIEQDLISQNISYSKLTGQTRNRQQVIDQFQQGEVRVFLVSLKAGGSGLNLTAADVVIHVDPWWNPAVENQATDRAYRIGQDKPVFVYKLVAADTIEERIQLLQQQKQALADSLFSDTGAVGMPMDKEALLGLLT